MARSSRYFVMSTLVGLAELIESQVWAMRTRFEFHKCWFIKNYLIISAWGDNPRMHHGLKQALCVKAGRQNCLETVDGCVSTKSQVILTECFRILILSQMVTPAGLSAVFRKFQHRSVQCICSIKQQNCCAEETHVPKLSSATNHRRRQAYSETSCCPSWIFNMLNLIQCKSAIIGHSVSIWFNSLIVVAPCLITINLRATVL